MRLIDADALKKAFNETDGTTDEMIDNAPVFKELYIIRHGKWLDYDETVRTSGHGLTCSECNGYVETAGPYCMHCGAKMEYREDD